MNIWAVVLAGGEGVRLRPLTRIVCGDERPKQFAALLDSRSLLRFTLDRIGLAVPAHRTVVVTKRTHARWMAAELAGRPAPRVLVQPEDRGTAAGVLLPAHWISHHDPDATVAMFPSDHYVQDEVAFMEHVVQVAGFVARQPGRCVLLGARPLTAETEYGWIGPGDPLGWIADAPISRVLRFWEKPSRQGAQAALGAGYLWNTFILVAKVATLIEAGRRHLPQLSERLAALTRFVGTDEEPWAMQQAYALAPAANFSSAVLQRGPGFLAVSRLPAVGWSDWGTPERVLQTLEAAGIWPAWRRTLAAGGEGR